MHPVLIVFIYGMITALATGLGALPFAFVPRVSPRLVAYANSIASGLMLGASFGLVAEGTEHGAWQTIIGANLGVVFILAGLAMIVLPGQGVLTILIGLALTNFPGKYALEQRLVRRPAVSGALNWIRQKAGRPPLEIPEEG